MFASRLLAALGLCFCLGAAAAPPSAPVGATDVVRRADGLLWGKTLHAEFDMSIVAPGWTRTLALRAWMHRPGRSLLRVLGPAKDAGIGSLRIDTEMWNYVPAIERTIKIPPSLMLQPWLGSDFTNDDLVRESSIVDDYTHTMLETPAGGGAGVFVVQADPKPQAPVVWGRILYTARADFVPLKQQFFDERGRLVRTLTYSEVRRMGGREIPTRWEMQPVDKPGKSTTIVLKAARYDSEIDPGLFSLRQLARRD